MLPLYSAVLSSDGLFADLIDLRGLYGAGRLRLTVDRGSVRLSAGAAPDALDVIGDYSVGVFEVSIPLTRLVKVERLTGNSSTILVEILPHTADKRNVTAALLSVGIEIPMGGSSVRFTPSPRDTARMKGERKPVVMIDRVSPNTTWGDLQILSVVDGSMYAAGMDRTIRSSSDYGASWYKLAQAGAGQYAKFGMWFRTSTHGTIITTWHPDGGGAPTIRRSTNFGASFTDVVAAQTNVDYLGVTSVCQDPVTGTLYLGEYITADAATVPTMKISKSDDNGATWTTFKTFSRDAVANPNTAVRHCHGIQWDQHDNRMYFLTGDNENASGIYRCTADKTDIEPVFLKSSQSVVPMSATAVGVMFFPNYIVWGQDATGDAWLLRLPRNQIGVPNSVVEKIMHLQSTSWYTVRTASDGTEWIMCVSTQPIANVAPLDRAIHLYRVADDGATCDEIGSIPTTSETQTGYFWPLGTPLQSNTDGYVWIGSNVYSQFEAQSATAPHIGQQFKISTAWGVQPLTRPDSVRKAWLGQAQNQSSGKVTVAASEVHTFGHTKVPNNARRLFIFDMGVWKPAGSGAGAVKVRIWNASAANAVLNKIDSVAIQTTATSVLHDIFNNEAAPNVFVSDKLTAGNVIFFDIVETSGTGGSDATAYVQFAWGY